MTIAWIEYTFEKKILILCFLRVEKRISNYHSKDIKTRFTSSEVIERRDDINICQLTNY